MEDRPRIYDYFDYRDYLGDIFSWLKRRKTSMRSIAKEVGLSNAYLTMILKRKRNMDTKHVDAFGDFLKLNVSERSYFRNLILLSDSGDSSARSEAFRQLSRFRSYKSGRAEDVATHKYLKHWHYVAIRELSFLSDFKQDPEWIQRRLRPKLRLRQVEEALAFLSKHRLLANSNDEALDCSENIYRLSLGEFHREMLKVASDSIDDVPREKRQLLGFTKSLSKKSFHKASQIMREALEKLERLEKGEEAERELYHFYLMGFPLTEKEEK